MVYGVDILEGTLFNVRVLVYLHGSVARKEFWRGLRGDAPCLVAVNNIQVSPC
jgi:hypothetical protein